MNWPQNHISQPLGTPAPQDVIKIYQPLWSSFIYFLTWFGYPPATILDRTGLPKNSRRVHFYNNDPLLYPFFKTKYEFVNYNGYQQTWSFKKKNRNTHVLFVCLCKMEVWPYSLLCFFLNLHLCAKQRLHLHAFTISQATLHRFFEHCVITCQKKST